jgi:HPt (histidine-containing phosphotransfer) domain-containing protein
LTANAVYGMKEFFLQNGLNDFLPKPIVTSALEEILTKWLPEDKIEALGPKEPLKEIDDSDQLLDMLRTIEGLDVQKGLTTLGGRIPDYLRILKVFRNDSERTSELLRTTIQMNNYELFTINIHAVKSASATVGAMSLSMMAEALEAAARQKDASFLVSNFGHFMEDFSKLVRAIDQFFIEKERQDVPGKKLGLADFRLDLIALRRAFENYDAKSLNTILNRLRSVHLEEELRKAIDLILAYFLEAEYEQAIGLIDNLLLSYADNPQILRDPSSLNS